MKSYCDMTPEERQAFRTVPMRATVLTRGNSHCGAGTPHLVTRSQAVHGIRSSSDLGGHHGKMSSVGMQWSLHHHRNTALAPEYYADGTLD